MVTSNEPRPTAFELVDDVLEEKLHQRNRLVFGLEYDALRTDVHPAFFDDRLLGVRDRVDAVAHHLLREHFVLLQVEQVDSSRLDCG